MTVLQWISALLMLAGSMLTVIAAVGLNRFPDVFARMHAATKPATGGILLIALGAILLLPGDAKVRLTLVVLFQFIAAPLGAHAMSRSAYRTGREVSPSTNPDDLATIDPAIPSSEE